MMIVINIIMSLISLWLMMIWSIENDMMHGMGELKDPTGDSVYTGEFKGIYMLFIWYYINKLYIHKNKWLCTYWVCILCIQSLYYTRY